MDLIQKNLLSQIADLHEVPEGAYNIRANGESVGNNTTANIDIVKKEDKDGIDIIIKVIKTKYRHLKTGGIFFCTDATIVALSGILFRDIETALYAAIAVVTCSMVMDVVLYGRDGAKMIYIISDKWEAVTQRLLLELDIGVTHIEGYGAFSGREKKVIMCVMRKQLAPRTEEIIKEEDPEAFMIVTDATEIFGEGYKSYFSEKL